MVNAQSWVKLAPNALTLIDTYLKNMQYLFTLFSFAQ